MTFAGIGHDNYDAQSQAWLATKGITATSYDGSDAQKHVVNQALDDLNAALTLGQPLDADEAHFLVDYFDNDVGDPSSGDFLSKFLYTAAYNTGDEQDTYNTRDYSDESVTRVQAFIDSGVPLSAGLAVILCDKQFVRPSTEPGQTNEFKYFLNQYLINCGDPVNGADPGVGSAAPPALLISTLGAQSGLVLKDSLFNPGTLTNHDKAVKYAKDWISYLATHDQPIDQGLIDAYVGLDRSGATAWIGNLISSNMSADGSFNAGFAQLMQTYFQLDPKGTGTGEAITGTPSAPPYDSTPPTISGWCWLALQSLMTSVDADRPMDSAMLSQLDATWPWAGTYARWYALNQQATSGQPLDSGMLATLQSTEPQAALDVCETFLDGEIEAHQALNATYLNYVSAHDPAAARDLCTRALQDALQPTNRLLNADASSDTDNVMQPPTFHVDLSSMGGIPPPVAGDTVTLTIRPQDGGSATQVIYTLQQRDITQGYVDLTSTPLAQGAYSYSSTFKHQGPTTLTSNPSATQTQIIDTPTVRVDLHGMGTTLPQAGDTVWLTVHPDDGAGGDTQIPYVLQPTDISLGYVDLSTDTTLPQGSYTLTSHFDHPATAAPATPAYTSPLSTPLKLTMDGQAPTIADARWQADVLVLLLNEPGGAGLDGDSVPSRDAFDVTDGTTDYEVESVTVDAVNGTVKLKLKTPISGTGPVTVSYLPANTNQPLQDRAGNRMNGFTGRRTTQADATHPLFDNSASTLPLPAPPRALEMTAWNTLNQLDPSLGRQIWNEFAMAGLLPPDPSTDGKPTPLDLSTMDLETALWTVFTGRAQAVEKFLRDEIEIVQQKNDAMSQLNGLLTALNAMDAAMPSAAKSDANVSSSVGTTKWPDLMQQVNSAIDLVSAGTNLKLFSTPDGHISTATQYNELKIAIQQIKGQVDSLGTNQQSEMLRLQSLTTKRNECYDLISTHTQKIGDVRNRIIQGIT